MKYSNFLLAFSLISISAISYADDKEKGQSLYQACASCHGNNAEGNSTLKAPALAAQHNWYLEQQINNLKTGLRGAHDKDTLTKTMLPFLNQLKSTNDIKAISRYLGSLPSPKHASKLKGDMKNGYRYYQGKCGACHGDNAQGNKAFKAPKLNNLSADYLKQQMINFTTGVRGYHKDDKLGKQMAMMAKMTSGQELLDILYYIQSQSGK